MRHVCEKCCRVNISALTRPILASSGAAECHGFALFMFHALSTKMHMHVHPECRESLSADCRDGRGACTWVRPTGNKEL